VGFEVRRNGSSAFSATTAPASRRWSRSCRDRFPIPGGSPRRAGRHHLLATGFERLGIRIYQDSALVGSASIMRNFFAGREITYGPGILDVGRMRRS
jgi:hypothetical protein